MERSALHDNGLIQQQPIIFAGEGHRCGSTAATTNELYNTSSHIGALFIILACGTAACSFPLFSKTWLRHDFSKHALFLCRHFGTGVLVALAFAHLLPTAFENLWEECLPEFWTEGYDAMPGVIAMVAALVVMVVEMAFSVSGVRHSHGFEEYEEEEERVEIRKAQSPVEGDRASTSDAEESSSEGASPEHSGENAASNSTISQQRENRMILQCLLLEAGILFHSVFIGLSISLSEGSTFIALVIAISFHQIFEGLALGSRIAAIPSMSARIWKSWAMSVAYGMTCPIGQAIGLAVRRTCDAEGTTALLAVGIANAISAGMILYASLVQLLGEDLLSEKSYRELSLRSRIEATIAVLLGCALMALMAVWA